MTKETLIFASGLNIGILLTFLGYEILGNTKEEKMNKIDARYQIDPLIYVFLRKPFEAQRRGTPKYLIIVDSFREATKYYHFYVSYSQVLLMSPGNTKEGRVVISKEDLLACSNVRQLKSLIIDRILHGMVA
jgi:hypothetical protein